MQLSKKQKTIIREAFKAGYEADVKRGLIKNKKGLWVAGTIHKTLGYRMINISLPNGPSKGTMVYVHRLIAYAKYGEKLFKDNIEVRHLDGDRSNNRSSNIRLGSRSQNMFDIPEFKRGKAGLNKASKRRILSREDALTIKRIYDSKSINGRVERGVNKHLAELFKVNKSTISEIGRGKTYNAS